MSNKIIYFFYISIFLLLFVPSTSILWNYNRYTEAIDNERSLPLSALIKNRINQFDVFFEKEYLFKNDFILLYNLFKNILNSSPTKDIIIGKNGWLFYAKKNDGNPIELFKNIKSVSSCEKTYFKEELLKKSLSAEKIGAKFIFLIVPSKITMYNEKLPSYITKVGTISSTDQLLDYVKNEPIKILDLRVLKNHKKYEQLYYKRDSHWNTKGAFRAFEYFIDYLGEDIQRVKNKTSWSKPFPFSGDLNYMIGLPNSFNEKEIKLIHHDCQYDDSPPFDLGSHLKASCLSGTKKSAMIFHDSFMKRLYPLFATYFSNSHFIWKHPTSDELPALVEKINPDYIIEERTERYLLSDIGAHCNNLNNH